MRTLHTKLISAAAALALAAFGLTACGSDDSNELPETPATTETAGGDTTESPEDPAPGDGLTQENFVERTTNAMVEAGSYRVNLVIEADGVSQVVEADYLMASDPAETTMRMTTSGDAADGEFTVIVVDGMAYMQLPQIGDRWLVLDGSAPELGSAEDFTGQADLQSQMDNMQTAIIGFTAEPDAETIDGVSTTKVTLQLDTEQFVAETQDETIGETITMIYFVGPDDLPRRITYTVDPAALTMDMSNWGEPVDVTAPSEDQIVTFEELMSQQ